MLINAKNYLKNEVLSQKLNTFRKDILESINQGLLAVDPFLCLNNFLRMQNKSKVNEILIENQIIDVEKFNNIYLIAFGKAAIKMSLAIINKFKIKEGIISSNEEVVSISEKFSQLIEEYNKLNIYENDKNKDKNGIFNINLINKNLDNITYIRAGHPLPDENSLLAGEKIFEIIQKIEREDLVFILISGGGSALVESPIIPFETLKSLTSNLLIKGANINELNTIRKHLSNIKGGNLAKKCKGIIVSLILSDVPTDRLDVIASGPTFSDSSSFTDALNILKKYELTSDFENVAKIFEDGIDGKISETLKEKEYYELKAKGRIFNILVGSNNICCRSIIKYFIEKKYNTIYLGSLVEGNAEDISKVFSGFFKSIVKGQFGFNFDYELNIKFPVAIVWGGETTVIVKGNGKGGRNQDFILSFLNNLRDMKEILNINNSNSNLIYKNNEMSERYLFSICSFGTDGIDGVNPAAGAIADNWTIEYILKNKIELNNFLSNNDSFGFFEKCGDAIITGPTGTNVSDVCVLIIDKY